MATKFAEDKTCRLCGSVDTENMNIFKHTSKSIPHKITAVYPILFYNSDPLPKNICRKCEISVTYVYEEIQKVIKTQKKWIDNVKHNQPDHPYIQVLNIIEESKIDNDKKIKSIVPDFAAEKYFKGITSFSENVNGVIPLTSSFPSVSNITNKQSTEIVKQNFDIPDRALQSLNSNESTVQPKTTQNKKHRSKNASNVHGSDHDHIIRLQNKLQSNGCTLTLSTTVNETQSFAAFKSDRELESEPEPEPEPELHLEICKYCEAIFPDIKSLAEHQLCHMVVSIQKLFQKRYLDKHIRRGRLISINDKKYIRCLNCWKLFTNNEVILAHWSKGECNFFCQLCGKDFADSPKALREHVLAVHGISYKSTTTKVISSKNLVVRDLFNKTTKPFMPNLIAKIKVEPGEEPLLEKKISFNKFLHREKSSEVKVQCEKCLMQFPNYRSKNSHMRIHKKYSTEDDEEGKDSMRRCSTRSIYRQNLNDNNYDILLEISSDSSKNPNSGIRKKIKNEPIDSADMQEVPPKIPRLQVKKLCDLQDPSLTPQFQESSENHKRPLRSTYFESNSLIKDHSNNKRIFRCRPCGRQFLEKTEIWKHKSDCEAIRKFSCELCLRPFISPTDLQMHMMLHTS